MILDRGPTTIFERREISKPGERPQYELKKKAVSLYAELDFATSPVRKTPERQDEQIDARIRIHQHREIRPGDLVVLEDCDQPPEGEPVYKILRAYHGHEDESGQLITDLTLKAVMG